MVLNIRLYGELYVQLKKIKTEIVYPQEKPFPVKSMPHHTLPSESQTLEDHIKIYIKQLPVRAALLNRNIFKVHLPPIHLFKLQLRL